MFVSICIFQGGAAAKAAWPRLLNYLERFRLAPDIRCSLEVLAPTFLTNYPIHIRTNSSSSSSRLKDDESQSSSSEEEEDSMTQRQREAQYTDGGLLHDPDSDEEDAHIINAQPKHSTVSTACTSSNPQVERQRKLLTDAARAYLQRPVSFQNVAVSLQPIRLGSNNSNNSNNAPATTTPRTNKQTNSVKNKNKKKQQQPTMKVALIASTPPLDQDDDDSSSSSPPPGPVPPATCSTAAGAGTVKVIRLVNDIPLLDSAEAAACGLVKSVAKKAVWGSYGLQVALRADDSPSQNSTNDWVPTLDLEDSELAKPFLKTNHSPHALWNEHDDESSEDSDSDHDGMGRRRGARREQQRTLLPAKARIGELLVLVSITADPSSLPLPTLSKVCMYLM